MPQRSQAGVTFSMCVTRLSIHGTEAASLSTTEAHVSLLEAIADRKVEYVLDSQGKPDMRLALDLIPDRQLIWHARATPRTRTTSPAAKVEASAALDLAAVRRTLPEQ